MRLIPALRQLVHVPKIPSNQRRLLRMRPPLNLFLPLKRIRSTPILLAVNQFHRQPFRGEVRPYPVLMFPQAFHQVIGAAYVKGAVGTFENVEVGHNIPLLLVDCVTRVERSRNKPKSGPRPLRLRSGVEGEFFRYVFPSTEQRVLLLTERSRSQHWG